MNGVLGMARLLLGSDIKGEDLSRVKDIVRSGESLLDILNDLLDISKLEAGKLELEDIPFSPLRVVEDVVSVMAPRAKEKIWLSPALSSPACRRCSWATPTGCARSC